MQFQNGGYDTGSAGKGRSPGRASSPIAPLHDLSRSEDDLRPSTPSNGGSSGYVPHIANTLPRAQMLGKQPAVNQQITRSHPLGLRTPENTLPMRRARGSWTPFFRSRIIRWILLGFVGLVRFGGNVALSYFSTLISILRIARTVGAYFLWELLLTLAGLRELENRETEGSHSTHSMLTRPLTPHTPLGLNAQTGYNSAIESRGVQTADTLLEATEGEYKDDKSSEGDAQDQNWADKIEAHEPLPSVLRDRSPPPPPGFAGRIYYSLDYSSIKSETQSLPTTPVDAHPSSSRPKSTAFEMDTLSTKDPITPVRANRNDTSTGSPTPYRARDTVSEPVRRRLSCSPETVCCIPFNISPLKLTTARLPLNPIRVSSQPEASAGWDGSSSAPSETSVRNGESNWRSGRWT